VKPSFFGVALEALSHEPVQPRHGADPERTLGILEECSDEVAREAVAGRVGVEPSRLEARDAAPVGSRPEPALAVFGERHHGHAGQAIVEAVADERALREPDQAAAVEPDPQLARVALLEGHHGAARQAVARGVARERPVFEPREAGAARSHPEAAVAVLGERPHRVFGQPLPHRVGREHAALEPGQAAAVRADPESALAVRQQREDALAHERRGVPLVEHAEADAVEADEPLVGSEPQVAVPGLGDGVDGVLREAVVAPPDVAGELGQAPLRFEGQRASAARQRQDGEQQGREQRGRPLRAAREGGSCGALVAGFQAHR
jgi:hypothetical protein